MFRRMRHKRAVSQEIVRGAHHGGPESRCVRLDAFVLLAGWWVAGVTSFVGAGMHHCLIVRFRIFLVGERADTAGSTVNICIIRYMAITRFCKEILIDISIRLEN